MNRFLIALAAITIILASVSYSHANVQVAEVPAPTVAYVPQQVPVVQHVAVQAVPVTVAVAPVQVRVKRVGLLERIRINRAYRKSVSAVQVRTACVGVAR